MFQRFTCFLGLTSISMMIAASLHADEPFIVYQVEAPNVPKQPQACASSDGIIHLTFGVDSKIFYCNNLGGTFGSPVAAVEVPNLSLGMRRGPRIAATDNSIVITAIGGPQGKGKDGDLQAYRSEDQGNTWIGPIRVNDIEASAREGLHAMTVSDKGVYWCVWLDLRSSNTELYASSSVDDGRTWSENQLVYRSPDGSVCECCHPSIASSGDAIHVLFRNSLAGNRDMYLVSSNDKGKTFGRAQRQGIQNWQLSACPMDGGMLAIDKNQQLSTVWRRDRSILSIGAEANSETFLGVGDQPWIANSDDGFYSVWTSKRDGELLLMKPGSTDSDRLSNHASFPIIVSTSQPDSMVYVFWEKRSDQVFSIIGERIR